MSICSNLLTTYTDLWIIFSLLDEHLKQEVLQIIPLVREANDISEELEKNCTFHEMLVSALTRGLYEGRTKVICRDASGIELCYVRS